MTLSDLEYLIVVAERGNIGRAAEALGLSQPALTRAIRRLEKLAGQDLFVRHPRGVNVTPAGERLLARARRILTEYGDALHELQDLKAGHLGLLRVGYSATVDERMFGDACRALMIERPVARLTIANAFMQPLLAKLDDGLLDLVIGPRPTKGRSDLEVLPLYADEIVCVADSSHPLRQRARLAIADLAKARWLLPGADLPVRADLDRIFAKAGLGSPKVRVESNHITVAQFKLLRGTGLLALAQLGSLKSLKRHGIEMLKVSGFNLKREIAVLRRAGGFVSPLSLRLQQLMLLAAQTRSDTR
ncbi:MAG: LysR family transcriptional regulator [Hyphomicrobiales bacterium]|nr:MAG: LysR family transcriptional regulator [Hyphomicrobiales bacterium]